MTILGRRQFLSASLASAGLTLLCGCSLVHLPLSATRHVRIGVLTGGPPPTASTWQEFRDQLQADGWIEGQTLTFDWRTDVDQSAMMRAATDLVAASVDVIVVGGIPAALAALAASSVVPTVGISISDPVASGLVSDPGHPSGNFTGTAGSPAGYQDLPKDLELAKQVVPGLSGVAILFRGDNPGGQLRVEAARQAAEEIGLSVQPVGVTTQSELEAAFSAASTWGAKALVLASDPLFNSVGGFQRVTQLAAMHDLADFYNQRGYVDAGGLLSSGPQVAWKSRTAADMVDRILRGARVSDVSVQYPTLFEMVVNSTTAARLGVTIPPDLVSRVTDWVS
jgi:putative ABC transport system substrate-binding protein